MVLGLGAASVAGIAVARVHDGRAGASLVAAADVPAEKFSEEYDMRSVGWIVAATVSSSAIARGDVPEGWMMVADSATQFTGIQGTGGWSYLFDTGEGTPVALMPFFGPSPLISGASVWTTCGGFNCYCIQWGEGMHANSPGACSAPWAGVLRPIRRWDAQVGMPIQIDLAGTIASNTDGLRVDLLLDGKVVLSQLGQNGLNTKLAWSQTTTGHRVELRLDPVGDDCNADVVTGLSIRVFTPDCNGNLIADAVELANGSASDLNGDGIPDGCQCFGDVIANGTVDGADLSALLSVWGTSGGIYPSADCSGDGVVNGQDLAIVLGGWGACP